jgi:hypothetical protein
MSRQVCPFHSDEDVAGVFVSDEVGERFVCDRATGHPSGGPGFEWVQAPPPPPGLELGGLGAELGLHDELPAALAAYAGRWVEYGVLERAYARRQPSDFLRLVETYGHTAIAKKRYTSSAYLGGVLGRLGRDATIHFHDGEATGRWAYNPRISWWTITPGLEWGAETRLSNADDGNDITYVPGQVEQ